MISPDKNCMPGIKPTLDILRHSPESIQKILVNEDRNDKPVQQILELCQKRHIPVEFAPLKTLNEITRKNRSLAHQGVISILASSESTTLEELLENTANAPLPLVLALDQVRDPGNLGALARSAYALGCAGMIIPKHNSAGISPGACKASAGALPLMPICLATNLGRALDSAEEAGFSIYGAASPGPGHLNAFDMDYKTPLIIVLGSEESGLRAGIAKRCQAMVTIPFGRNFESLNVAQAGGMLLALFAAAHARKK